MSDPTDLHDAAAAGDLVGVRRCLAAGVSVDSVDEQNRTALYLSSVNGHLSVVNYLVNQGADIERENGDIKHTALFTASFHGHLPVVTFLVESGADLEHKSSGGYTPVLVAAERGHLPVIRYLAEQGAELDARDHGGHNATHRAAINGHLNVIKYVEERGCDMNAKTNSGNNPYHLAAGGGQIAIMQYLDSRGVSREALNDSKETPIMYAAFGGQLPAVKQLVLQRAKTDVVDNEGWSLVHSAVQGADVNVVNNFGSSALHRVCMSSQYSSSTDQLTAAQLLVKHGSRVDGRNKAGKTPADYVRDNEQLKLFLQESAARSQPSVDAGYASTWSWGGIGKKLKID